MLKTNAQRQRLGKHKIANQRSVCDLERRSKGAGGVFDGRVSVRRKRSLADFAPTKVKLERAQGECLGIRSR